MREVTPFSNPLTYDPFPGSLCITQRHRNALCESVSHIFIIAGSITLHHFMRTIKARGATLIALAMARVKLAKPYVFLEITANYRTFHAAYTNVFAEL